MSAELPDWLKVVPGLPTDGLTEDERTLQDFNLYDARVYGGAFDGTVVVVYDQPYDGGLEPVDCIEFRGWHPPHLDDDTWLLPLELPRRVRRALNERGWIL